MFKARGTDTVTSYDDALDPYLGDSISSRSYRNKLQS